MKKRILAILLIAVTLFSLTAFAVTYQNQVGYAAVYKDGKYDSQKMSAVLAGNDRYKVVDTFKVDLFDYDPETINAALNAVTSDGNGFHFTGYGVDGCGSNNGINNSSSEFAKQGILRNTLENGLPVVNFLKDTDAGINTGKVLFSDSEYQDKKTTYDDIPFEMIYDSATGYYEYKSSANHAQLNAAGTKIELYADTLSTDYSYIETLDLSTAADISDIDNCTKSKTSFKGTAKDQNTNNRMDPYVSFSVKGTDGNGVPASSVGKIYVKAKVPASVGENQFQVFFDTNKVAGMAEARSYIVPYTSNGDWIEFVINTSECSEWKDNIKNLRIDLYDGNKGSLNTSGEYSIEIAQVSLLGKDSSNSLSLNGGFYPFSDIRSSYTGNGSAFDLSAWSNIMQKNEITTATASRSMFTAEHTADQRYAKLAYGMVMEFDFYLPVDKSEQELTYYFNGDDDLWVFVDGKLALDIGGGHGAITGELNFSTGAIEVANAVTVTDYNAGATATASKKTGTLDSSLTAPGKHTMKIFYLERGGSVSNCFMKFNLPQTPTGSVSVSKNVTETNGEDISVLAQETFEFIIQACNNGAGDNQTMAPLANQDYILVNADNTSSNEKTDENGKFTLMHGQKAVFDIDENYRVTVTETTHKVEGYENQTTTVNGKEGTEETKTTVKNQEAKFEFVNTYTEETVDITYIPVNPANCPDDVKGTVELTGNTESATSEETGVSETVGKRVGEPVGSTATETKAVKFVGWYADADCTELISEEEILMPEKADGSNLWEETTYYAKFEYQYGDLKITKTGIDDLDYHNKAEGSQYEAEYQSTIYVIEGTSDAGESIKMEVVIHGNGSVTIKDLPVGTYTVTEKTDWAWRYNLTGNNGITVEIDGKLKEVTFTNTRNQPYWLGGDHFFGNLFGAFTAANTETPNE